MMINHWEDPGKLNICVCIDMMVIDQFADIAVLYSGFSKPFGCRIAYSAFEFIMISIRTDAVFVFSDWNYVEADPGREIDLPIVFGDAGQDVVVVNGPVFSDVAVFDPDGGVFVGETYFGNGVLGEDIGMGFYFAMPDLALVRYQVL